MFSSSGKGNATESGRDLPEWMLPEQQGRAWYGRKRKPAYRKATPKGGYDRYKGYDAFDDEEEIEEVPREGMDMPIAILVLGIVALALSVVPLIQYVAVVFAIAAVVLATREFARMDPASRIRLKGKDVRDQRFCRVGRLLAILAVVSVVASTIWGIKQDRDNRIKSSDSGTGLVLQQDLSVKFGVFTVGQDAVGAETRVLPVTVENKSGGTKSFEFQVECLDGENRRIASQTLFAPKMKGGEERAMEAFGYVDSETTQALKDATTLDPEACRVATAKSGK
jgi:hypothetical protein